MIEFFAELVEKRFCLQQSVFGSALQPPLPQPLRASMSASAISVLQLQWKTSFLSQHSLLLRGLRAPRTAWNRVGFSKTSNEPRCLKTVSFNYALTQCRVTSPVQCARTPFHLTCVRRNLLAMPRVVDLTSVYIQATRTETFAA